MITKERAEELAHRLLQNKITPVEEKELQAWYNDNLEEPFEVPESFAPSRAVHSRRMLKVINAATLSRPVIRLWPRVAIAAAVAAAIVSAGLWFVQTNNTDRPTQMAQTRSNDIAPGGNKAFLTLSNGKRISLTDATNGNIARQSGISITKTAEGKVIYNATSPDSKEIARTETLYNTIETPKGGQYQIQLPDGTMVWLNAASSLKYPVSFANLNQRKVILTGEGYFEVSKDKTHPFIVKTDQQEVKVLGTHFNINSYTNESAIKTTLLEGSVQVTRTAINRHPEFISGSRINNSNIKDKSKSAFQGRDPDLRQDDVVLKPGQQSVLLTNGQVRVEKADTELAVAWKNNQFMFDEESIQHIMKMVERWYNVEVIYEGQIPDDKFGGAVSRFDNVSSVLRILETTKKVHFRIEGQKIYVFK